jgi:myosin heavy chain 6/7
MKQGSHKLLVVCFHDHPGQPLEAKKDAGGGGKKKGGGKTVTSFFKSQLDDLMKVLYSTDPSFIRCVVPNTHKQPGGVQPDLIMHQYHCNGVLAGIAICRLGFPNKLMYPDFKARYNILAAGAVAKAKNDKGAAQAVMDAIKLDPEKWRLGHTKVFFRAGILGLMEETREDKIGSVLALLQAQARGKASRLTFKKMQDQKLALYCLQRTIRNFRIGKTWLWWQLWLAVKPNLKCTKFAQYKAEYEEKIAIAEAHIGKALDDRQKVEAVHQTLLSQKNELVLALQSGGSAVQDIIDKAVRVESMAADVQKQVAEVNNRIKTEKEERALIGQSQSKVTSQKGQLGEEIKALEGRLSAAESDRADKDDQIRTCKEELEHQNEMISKLGRDKKGAQESRQKTEEDIQTMEDRCNHLSRVKAKLEQSLDESEDSLEREKKAKGDVEKLKRKVEGDLKLTQETVSDLERMKAELTQGVQRKEKESAAIAAKIEDESTLGSKYSKQTKELQSRLEELDEELSIERGNRAKAEKSRAMLKKDLEDLGSRLEEAGANTATQVELNKKREAELARLKGELEELNIAHEGTLAALRMKHNNTMAELGEQIDGINSNKMKADKDKAGMERDLQEARSNLEDAVRAKAEMDKNGKLIQGSIVDSHQKLDELARALNEADSQKKRLDVEKQDLERQIEEGEAAMANLNKNKISLTTQLEDTKRLGDAESRDRSAMLSKFKNLSTELENLRERIDDEHQRKSDALKALSKATAEIQLWRSRYETEGLGRVDELESSRNKLQARIQEAEETVDSLQQKIATAEKSKGRMQSDLEEISMEYERTHAAAIITEKRGRNFDKVVGEWKSKAEDVAAEVEASQKECRNYNSELFRLKAAHDEVVEQLDVVKRENKNLADEIKDLLDQLGDGGRSIHELDKQRRRLEVEKEELQAALEEAEAALEQEENKVLRAQLELGQVRQEIDRKIQEKEEEFDNTRKNHQRAMDSLGASLEAEQRAKSEALRIKKKLESDINELEIALDHANKANSEGQKAIKRYQGSLRDTIQSYEDEARSRQEVMEQVGISERKANALSGEVEESRALLDSADRSKRQLDSELADARNAVNEMGVINSRAMHDKRNVESIIHTLQAEIDDALAQAKNSEEKSKRAMVDAARLADELRSEQDHANAELRGKRGLETQITELLNRLEEAEAAAMKGGKAAMSKLEMKIRELEVELGAVQSRTQENYKGFQRAERRIKELQFSTKNEDKKKPRSHV